MFTPLSLSSVGPTAQGTSGARLFGSFGEIALSLNGFDNKPKADVKLEPGWLVYEDVRLPSVGYHLRAPKRVLSMQKLEKLFLRQHKKSATLWLWNQPVPTLTFVKEVPHSVATEAIEVSIEVSDEDAQGDRGRRREAGSK